MLASSSADPAKALPSLIQKASQANEEAKLRIIIGADGTIWKNTDHGWQSVGWIKDKELAEDFKVSQLCQRDR